MITPAVRLHRNLDPWLAVFACLALMFAAATPGRAVENIRQVRWVQTEAESWNLKMVSTATLTFEATLTAMEVADAVTSFSVAVQHPAGGPALLASYSCGHLPADVPSGTPASFTVGFTMTCDPLTRSVDILPGFADMRYLHPSHGQSWNRFLSGAMGPTSFPRGSFGLVVADMNGALSTTSLASESFACVTAPENGSIGVYFDPEGTICSGTIPAGTTGKVYIVAKAEGGTAYGVAGAEFRFTGVPEAWDVYAVPNAEIVALGNPFTDGVVTGFICQQPMSGAVVLYTVAVVAHEDVSDVRFEIGPRVPPVGHSCPLLLACDSPFFTKFCVEGGSCFVNATSPPPCATLPVAPTTWSVVKSLYR